MQLKLFLKIILGSVLLNENCSYVAGLIVLLSGLRIAHVQAGLVWQNILYGFEVCIVSLLSE